MKKLIIAMALMLIPLISNAQLNVKSVNERAEIISTERTGLVKLIRKESHEYDFHFLIITSTNRFDDPFELYLGKSKEEAIKTLQDLIDLVENLGSEKIVTIENVGKECRIERATKNVLYIYADGYAGLLSITKSELKRFLGVLDSSKQPQKFADPLYQDKKKRY